MALLNVGLPNYHYCLGYCQLIVVFEIVIIICEIYIIIIIFCNVSLINNILVVKIYNTRS